MRDKTGSNTDVHSRLYVKKELRVDMSTFFFIYLGYLKAFHLRRYNDHGEHVRNRRTRRDGKMGGSHKMRCPRVSFCPWVVSTFLGISHFHVSSIYGPFGTLIYSLIVPEARRRLERSAQRHRNKYEGWSEQNGHRPNIR